VIWLPKIGQVGTRRDLSADRVTTLLFGLVNLAAMVRVWAAFGSIWTMPLLFVSACLWIAAFAGFALAYERMLLLPRDSR
jgi:uncharacterized protein involved in response to NO